MRQEAWRAYLELALGVTDQSRKKATKAVKQLLGKGGATTEQLQGLADELLRTGSANRDALVKLVRTELDRALSRLGLATADEVAELNARVRQLEMELVVAHAEAADLVASAPAVAVAVPVPAGEPFGGDVEAQITEPVVPVEELGAAEQLAAVVPLDEAMVVEEEVTAVIVERVSAEAEPTAADRAADRAAERADERAAARAAAEAREPRRAAAKKTAKKAAKKAPAAKAAPEKAAPAKETGRKAAAKKTAAKATERGSARAAAEAREPRRAAAKKAPAKKAAAKKASARTASRGEGAGA
jgi:polyhydroxyalkanoate synthesis regulator phasin